ncbi:AMP-binding protein [Actinoplanes friuliensis]|uniref:Non-ribosomal peptide synthase:amino acid adenylation n=1 Tax=Actinoplanes friuliensis DSM 7358 TaxID=1246995 RepID=U5W6Z2_9ACTN|nr:AMP-binding protein [Actinoplanes friuliensis]AGZ44772.1 non-ribosomal peptide synthase:amino acid adenylation [Actinoplanes friuliensis DSM 7358]
MRLPLSQAQLGVWHALRLDPASPAFDIGGHAELPGPIEADLLERAVGAMVAEVAAFRVRFDDTTEPVTQVIAPEVRMPLARLDLTGPEAARAWMRAELGVPRDPTRDPLLEVALLRVGDERHWWFVRSHHLVLDGYSVPLVCGRVAHIYTALLQGADPGPSPFAPYRGLLDAETAYRESPDFGADREFWLGRMAGAHDVPTLGGRIGPPLGPFHRSAAELPAAVAETLRGRTWVPAVMAAFAGYLARLTGAGELRLGVPLAGRSGPLLRTPGNAANLLPLRVAVRPGRDPADLMAAVAAELRQVVRHQRYRGEDLARDLGAVGAGPALFGPSVNIRDFDHGLTFGAGETMLHDVTAGPVEDLTLSVRREGSRFGLYLDGNAGAYSRSDVEAHLPRFVDYLTAFTGRRVVPRQRSGEYESADQARARRTGGHRHGPAPAVRPPGLAEAFAQQVRATPDALALHDGDRRWTFAALTGRVDRLAAALRVAGAGPEKVVALMLPRGAEYVIGLLAVARTGAAWTPVDPARVAHIPRPDFILAGDALAGEARVGEVLAGNAWGGEVLAGEGAVVAAPPVSSTGGVPLALAAVPVVSVASEAEPPSTWPVPDPRNLASVIATSGSTGSPRAVAVTHGAIANLLSSHRTGIMTATRLRVGHTAPFTVDAALDPLLWMVAGHELVLLPEETYRDPYALVSAVREARVDLIDVPPSYLRVLLDAGLLDGEHRPGVVVFGGEAAPAELWRRLRVAAGRGLNAYGPTEFTVDALVARVSDTEAPVLGVPVAGARALVLDGALRPVPEGGVGELYLGGPGLARGYAGQPGLTAGRFVADPVGPPGERLFRTGDLVRLMVGGDLVFLGRTDDQLKIRGFRVEPGETEAVLAADPGVLACAVVPKPGPGGTVLVAYVVPAPVAPGPIPGQAPGPAAPGPMPGPAAPGPMPGQTPRPVAAGAVPGPVSPDLAAGPVELELVSGPTAPGAAGSRSGGDELAGLLMVRVRSVLPEHLVPAAIMVVPELPLAADGTLDRRALPAPELRGDRPYRAPGTVTESALCDCFAEVLEVGRVGADDDFFALGGHSLLAGRLQGVIRERLDAGVSLRAIFTHRTARALAGLLDRT